MENKDYDRPNPDDLLASITSSELQKKKGKLRIFFGMAAGVGKTYQMLETAKSLKNEGKDIVIGYIETHKRADTEMLLKDFEIIPRAVFSYRNTKLEDTDIDAILKRKPEIVLIDELAHTNAQGCRNKKRYQDVFELLENGIDVWTTLNVQHLESRASTVEQITGIKITETLPDSVLEKAHKIELIDLAPEDLLKRLKDGKIYAPEKVPIALNNFFQKSYLTALREMSLQITAKLVDVELYKYLKSKNVNTLWKTNEKLISAIGSSPYSEYIIRWTKRIAFNLKADWYAVYVETGSQLNAIQEKNLKKNINLARELGAEIIIISDDDVVSGIIRTARQKKATQIITGKPLYRNFKDIFSGSIPERIIKQSGDIDVYIVSEPGSFDKMKISFFNMKLNLKFNEIWKIVISLTGITLFNLLIFRFINYLAVSLIFLVYVIFVSLFSSRTLAILNAGLTAVIWNFFFIPPRFTIFIEKIEDIFMFIIFFIVAVITASLSAKIRLKEYFLHKRELMLTEVSDFSKLLNRIIVIDDLINISNRYLARIFKADVSVVFEINTLSETDKTISEWVKSNKKPAGKFTDTFPNSECYYYPLISGNIGNGAVIFKFDKNQDFSYEKENLIQTFAIMISSIAERINAIEKSRQAAVENESQKLFSIILKSISHELRTPLTSLSLSVNGLLDEAVLKNSVNREMLILDIKQSAIRLNRIVGNLLDMARLESGKLSLHLKFYDIIDIINAVLSKYEMDLQGHKIITEFPDDLPLIKIDGHLIENVISNILTNAVYYTAQDSLIKISVLNQNDQISIIISDNGQGISDTKKIFEKFYRENPEKTGGLGLGLTICKEIIEMHKGQISAKNGISGGAEFTIILPVILE